MDLLDDCETGFFVRCPAELQDHGKALFSNRLTNTERQRLTSKHTLDRSNMCLQTPVLMNREISVLFESKEDRLGLLMGIDGVVYSSELLSSTGSQRNLKG